MNDENKNEIDTDASAAGAVAAASATATVGTTVKTMVQTKAAAEAAAAAAAPAAEASVLISCSFSYCIFHFDVNFDFPIFSCHRWCVNSDNASAHCLYFESSAILFVSCDGTLGHGYAATSIPNHNFIGLSQNCLSHGPCGVFWALKHNRRSDILKESDRT